MSIALFWGHTPCPHGFSLLDTFAIYYTSLMSIALFWGHTPCPHGFSLLDTFAIYYLCECASGNSSCLRLKPFKSTLPAIPGMWGIKSYNFPTYPING